MTNLNEVWAAYAEGEGRWAGCNWPTRFGYLGLDLNGTVSDQARATSAHWLEVAAGQATEDVFATGGQSVLVAVAQHLRLPGGSAYLGGDQDRATTVRDHSAWCFCARMLAAEWQFAAEWLEQVEADAAWAEAEARLAVAAAECHDWDQAGRHARQACLIEADYGSCRPWRHLRYAVDDGAA